VKRQVWLRAMLVATLALGSGLALLQPQVVSAQAPQARVFLALANGVQETPPVPDSQGTAFGRFILSADRTQIIYEIHMSGLKAPFTGMHLHRGRAGVPGPVVYPLANPVNGVSVGVVPFNAADEQELANGGFYLNIHTSAHPGGEIRSQVQPSPASLSLPSNP
jgi:hypothetical protein